MYLKETTGEIARRMIEGINKENVGYDPDFSSSASLREEEDGRLVWTTAWSGFTYTLLAGEEDAPAKVVYEGANAGLLSQNLLPDLGEVLALNLEESTGVPVDDFNCRWTHPDRGESDDGDVGVWKRAYALLQELWRQGLPVTSGHISAAMAAAEIEETIRRRLVADAGFAPHPRFPDVPEGVSVCSAWGKNSYGDYARGISISITWGGISIKADGGRMVLNNETPAGAPFEVLEKEVDRVVTVAAALRPANQEAWREIHRREAVNIEEGVAA